MKYFVLGTITLVFTILFTITSCKECGCESENTQEKVCTIEQTDKVKDFSLACADKDLNVDACLSKAKELYCTGYSNTQKSKKW